MNILRKLVYIYYDKFFFYYFNKGHILFLNRRMSIKVVESKFFLFLLRYVTKYTLILRLESFYNRVKTYDYKDTNGLLQFPKNIYEECSVGYLVTKVMLGYIPTLKKNPIELQELLKLNNHHKDKSYSKFLEDYLSYYWENPKRSVTKNKLDGFLKNN